MNGDHGHPVHTKIKLSHHLLYIRTQAKSLCSIKIGIIKNQCQLQKNKI